MKSLMKSMVALVAVASLPGGPGAKTRGGGGGGMNPDSCGDYASKAGDVGKKVKAFMDAAVYLDKATAELEGGVKSACLAMGKELGLAGLDGDTKTVCKKVADEVRAGLQVSVKSETKLVAKYKPAECKVNASLAIEASAQCEASAEVKAEVVCQGTCGGTCAGKCDGTCKAKNADGSCNGECQGTCQGSCSGSCDGNVTATGSAECRASAEVRANLEAECTPPEVEYVYEQTAVVDDAKFKATLAAIKAGLPQLLAMEAKAKLVAKGIVNFGKTAADLAGSAKDIASAFGDAAFCVAGQLAAVAGVFASVEVRVEVSVEASAEVGGARGASGS